MDQIAAYKLNELHRQLAGVNYRIATGSAKIINSKLYVNAMYSQTLIEYRQGSGQRKECRYLLTN